MDPARGERITLFEYFCQEVVKNMQSVDDLSEEEEEHSPFWDTRLVLGAENWREGPETHLQGHFLAEISLEAVRKPSRRRQGRNSHFSVTMSPYVSVTSQTI